MKVQSLCFFLYRNIFRALLLRIEHWKTEKSTHRLPIYRENNTWARVDMEFLFSCSNRHLTRSLRSLVSYRVRQRLYRLFALLQGDLDERMSHEVKWLMLFSLRVQICLLLIKTEIKVGSAILNHVFTLTFMKFKLIGICIMQKVRI